MCTTIVIECIMKMADGLASCSKIITQECILRPCQATAATVFKYDQSQMHHYVNTIYILPLEIDKSFFFINIKVPQKNIIVYKNMFKTVLIQMFVWRHGCMTQTIICFSIDSLLYTFSVLFSDVIYFTTCCVHYAPKFSSQCVWCSHLEIAYKILVIVTCRTFSSVMFDPSFKSEELINIVQGETPHTLASAGTVIIISI